MPKKYASRNCQDGLYIPLLFTSLGFPLNTQNVIAVAEMHGNSVGMYSVNIEYAICPISIN